MANRQRDTLLVLNSLMVLDYLLEDLDAEEARRKRRRQRQRHASRERRCWVQPWVDLERQSWFGQYSQLMEELRIEDPASFRNFIRVEPAMFDELVQRLTPRLQKQHTYWMPAIDPALKVAITLRHLASESITQLCSSIFGCQRRLQSHQRRVFWRTDMLHKDM